jgi:hypothetical protein
MAVGAGEGGPVPALDLTSGTVDGYLRDEAGELLLSRVEDDFLGAVSRRGGGVHLRGSEPAAVEQMAEAIRGAAAPPADEGDGMPLFAWLSLAAFAALLLEPAAASIGGRR